MAAGNMRYRKSKTRVTLIALALLLPFIFLSSKMEPWSNHRLGIGLLQDLFFPVEIAWHETTGRIKDGWNSYINLRNVAKENQELRKQLTVMQGKALDYDSLQQETDRLRSLLGFAKKYKRRISVVEVLSFAKHGAFESLRIASGSLNEIRIGMPVVAAKGLIGRILRRGLKFSDVQVLGDPNFNLDVVVERTRVRGILKGDSAMQCILQLHRRADIRIGDTIVTSGIVKSLPKGLPVGKVVRIRYDADNVSQIITVQPWVDHRQLDEVMVLDQVNEVLETVVETAGPTWLNISEKNLKTHQHQ